VSCCAQSEKETLKVGCGGWRGTQSKGRRGRAKQGISGGEKKAHSGKDVSIRWNDAARQLASGFKKEKVAMTRTFSRGAKTKKGEHHLESGGLVRYTTAKEGRLGSFLKLRAKERLCCWEEVDAPSSRERRGVVFTRTGRGHRTSKVGVEEIIGKHKRFGGK